MKTPKRKSAQQSLLFRIVAFFSKLQFRYIYSKVKSPRLAAALFLLISGSSALATLAFAAHILHLPLLFPPLGPSAFIMFCTPMSPAASPRNTVLSHALAVVSGLVAIYLTGLFFQASAPAYSTEMSWAGICAVVIATSLSISGMVALKAYHPPAVASALLAACGYFDDLIKALGLVLAAIVLATEACFFNRILGGLPYPFWKADPDIYRNYGVLAGLPAESEHFWDQLSRRLMHRR